MQKHISALLLSVFFCFEVKPQNGLFINGNNASLLISSNNKLYVTGDVQNLNCSSIEGFTNNGTIILTGSFLNNDSLFNDRPNNSVPGSEFIFTGNVTQTIRGSSPIPFFKLTINKPSGELQLHRNIYIKDTLRFLQRDLNLNGKNLEMRYPSGFGLSIRNPFLLNENNSNHIYGDSGSVFVSTIKDAGKPNDLGNLGLTIMDSDSKHLNIKRKHVKQFYAGNGSVKRYFDVTSDLPLNTGIIDSLLVRYINNSEISQGTDPNYFKIFVSQGSDMDYTQLPSANSPGTNSVHARTYDLTSPEIQMNLKQFRITAADNNCSDPPISHLPIDTIYLCSGDSTLLDAGNQTSIPNTSLKWNWSTGASSQSIWIKSVTGLQNISIKLTDVRGCITNDTVIVAPTAPSPFTSFIHTNVCLGDSILFTNNSSISSGSYTSYWQLGNGSISNSAAYQFSKYFNAAGKFYVNLKNTSNYNCISQKLDSLIIFPQPKAQFFSTYNCSIHKMELTDSSKANFGSIKSWLWSMGESPGDTLRILSPSPPSIAKDYSVAGTYSVSLIVTTFQGCMDTTQNYINISAHNQASFTANNVCLGDTVIFNNTSICNTGICNYAWNFGDGTKSTQPNPAKKYSSNSGYNVKLKIAAPQGCPDSIVKSIFVNPLPNTGFNSSANNICLGDVVYFTNQSTPSGLTYLWDFGNGSTTNSINAFQNYASALVYAVRLTAISDSGCNATAVKIIIVHNNPVAQYHVDPVCNGEFSVFNSTSTGIGLSCNWDLGNTQTSNLSQPSYVYPVSGNYNTRLVITDNYACADTTYQTAVVNPLPIAGLGGTIFTCGDSYILNAGNTASNYLWLPVNIPTASLKVVENGSYTLKNTDANGCTGTEQVNVTLNSQVQPDLGNDSTVCGSYILNAGYPGSSFSWNDLESSQQINVTGSGTYFVQVTDQNNCIGSDTVEIALKPITPVSLGDDISECENSGTVVLSPGSSFENYIWNTGNTSSSIFINNSGFYWVKATDKGCPDYDTIYVNLLPSPVINLGSDITTCAETLLDAQNIGNTYLWSDGNTTGSITVNTSDLYSVMVTDPVKGCFSYDSINVTINNSFDFSLGNDTTVCSDAIFMLDAGISGAVYSWNNGSTTQTIGVNSSGLFFVEVSRGVCSATDYIHVTLSTIPIVELGEDIQYICSPTPMEFVSNISGDCNWGSSNGFNSTLSSIAVTEQGKYWLTVSKDGCNASDTVNLISSPYPIKAYFLASTTDSINKPVQFVDLSEPAPLAYSWDFGDGFYSFEANPIHIFLQIQTFNVSLEVSNGYCTDRIDKTLMLLKKERNTIPQPGVSLELIDFKLYPNPTSDDIQIELSMSDRTPLELYMYDINGNIVFRKSVGDVIQYYQTIPMNHLSTGLYLIQLKAQSAKGFISKTGKIVKME